MYEEDSLGNAAQWQMKPARRRRHRYMQNVPLEDFPKRDPTHIRCNDSIYDRHSGALFTGLAGMIWKGCGKPWAKVYAQASGRPFFGYRSSNQYYVHPQNGLLLPVKKEWTSIVLNLPGYERNRGWRDVLVDQVHYVDQAYYRKIQGLWFEVIYAVVPNYPRDYLTQANNWSPPRYDNWSTKREEDWLYKLNIRDCVLKERIRSDQIGSLASVHGYYYNGKMIHRDQYQRRVNEAARKRDYRLYGEPHLVGHEKSVYAKSLRQLPKSEIRSLGLHGCADQKMPSFVTNRKNKKGRAA
jgi:hypothetical protein